MRKEPFKISIVGTDLEWTRSTKSSAIHVADYIAAKARMEIEVIVTLTETGWEEYRTSTSKQHAKPEQDAAGKK